MARRILRQTTQEENTTGVVSVKSTLLRLKLREAIWSGSGIFPLTSPGLKPLPLSSAFVRQAKGLGGIVTETETKKSKPTELTPEQLSDTNSQLVEEIRSALRVPDYRLFVEIGPHRWKDASFLPGHLWGCQDQDIAGPRRASVMIVSKNPWLGEKATGRCLSDSDGMLLEEFFRKARCHDTGKFYVTHLVKFMPPDYKTTLKASWVKDGTYLLHHEILAVQPEFILCLGSDASKAILGSHAGVTDMEGVVETFRYNVAFESEDFEEGWREAKVMTVVHPRQVVRDQSQSRILERGIGRFVSLIRGKYQDKAEEVEHTVISQMDQLREKLIEIENDPDKQDSVIAVDAEWHGQHPVNSGSYMRSIQFAWKTHHAVGIKVHEAGGEITPGFRSTVEHPSNPDLNRSVRRDFIDLLNAFFRGGKWSDDQGEITFRPKRVVGHFFNADLEWLVDYGIDIQSKFSCPLRDYHMRPSRKGSALYELYSSEGFAEDDYVPAWYRTKFEGGADTGLMAHAIEETASYKLETLAMRYTSAPKYDTGLRAWKESWCKLEGLDGKSLEGYGMCPDDVLMPYGMYDADVTLRLFYELDVKLDEDYEGNSCREAFWESHIATPAVLEIHRTGIPVDRARIDFLTNRFMDAKRDMEVNLRTRINWPDFNIRSTQQVKELLFGYKLNGKREKETGAFVRIRPPGAMSLGIVPVFDTSKPPKPWAEIHDAGKQYDSSPSTNKQALSLLAQGDIPSEHAEIIRSLRDYRFLDQVLKTILRPPILDEETEEVVFDDDGNMEYEDGLAAACCDDGRVRTHIYQTKETGRWASARPNLQNISKSRDEDYQRLLGPHYKYSLRSTLKAPPGHVFIEADYIGAEIYGMAVMSGDALMIEHATRNQLPEDHPDFYDTHSNVACHAFKLNCTPTKSGLKSIGKLYLRNLAKTVIFGIAYGRGAKGIAIAAKEQGIDVTEHDAKLVIDSIFDMYPRLVPFFEECRQRATGVYVDPVTSQVVKGQWLCNCFGRFRRFPASDTDRKLSKEIERQAMNFPIQSMIASAMSRAIAYMHDYKERQFKNGHDMFRIVLQIHDAVLLQVPYAYVQHVCEYVLPKYMRDSVPLWPSSLDGIPTGDGPYYLGMEAEVMTHWGERMTYAEAVTNGLPTGYGGQAGCMVKYSHDKPSKPVRSVEKSSKERPSPRRHVSVDTSKGFTRKGG